MGRKYIAAIVLTVILFGCATTKLKDVTIHISTVNNNVCKKLKGDVVLYAIFVDSKETNPWTKHDIVSTLDSIQKAMSWLETQSKTVNIPLNIQVKYHKNNGQIPLENNFSKKTLSATLFGTNGVTQVDKWADKIAKEAMKSLGKDTTGITKTKIKPKDREALIARLRDVNKTDNVAIVYFINNYFKDELSVTLHSASDENTEYAIVSGKDPGVIAHEFLHLFGALDLYISPFDNKRKTRKRKEWAMKEFPNEIMAFAHRKIETLNIGNFTKYLIGWRSAMDDKDREMIIGKKIKVAKY